MSLPNHGRAMPARWARPLVAPMTGACQREAPVQQRADPPTRRHGQRGACRTRGRCSRNRAASRQGARRQGGQSPAGMPDGACTGQTEVLPRTWAANHACPANSIATSVEPPHRGAAAPIRMPQRAGGAPMRRGFTAIFHWRCCLPVPTPLQASATYPIASSARAAPRHPLARWRERAVPRRPEVRGGGLSLHRLDAVPAIDGSAGPRSALRHRRGCRLSPPCLQRLQQAQLLHHPERWRRSIPRRSAPSRRNKGRSSHFRLAVAGIPLPAPVLVPPPSAPPQILLGHHLDP